MRRHRLRRRERCVRIDRPEGHRPGLYTVEFSNVSTVDGHPWSGVTQFIVLNPDGTVPAGAEVDPDAAASTGTTGLLPKRTDAALKWIAMLALATVGGAAFFLLAVMRPAANFLDDEPRAAVVEAGERWVAGLAHVLVPLSFIASSVLIILTVGRFETGTTLWEYLTSVRAGEFRALSLLLLVVALAGTDLLFLAHARRCAAGLLLLVAARAAGLPIPWSATAPSMKEVLVQLVRLRALRGIGAWLGASPCCRRCCGRAGRRRRAPVVRGERSTGSDHRQPERDRDPRPVCSTASSTARAGRAAPTTYGRVPPSFALVAAPSRRRLTVILAALRRSHRRSSTRLMPGRPAPPFARTGAAPALAAARSSPDRAGGGRSPASRCHQTSTAAGELAQNRAGKASTPSSPTPARRRPAPDPEIDPTRSA
jgi:hypothetical protein